MRIFFFLLFFISLGCSSNQSSEKQRKPSLQDQKAIKEFDDISLDIKQAEQLIKLPLNCIANPLPYKSGLTIAKEEDLAMPIVHHPAFYGCFDWHSAVHGHWSIVFLLKTYPEISVQKEARALLNKNLTKENIQTEIEYFKMNKYTKSFERTYGWAWLLKLQEELISWEDPDAKRWADALQPLCTMLSQSYIEYLPKLVYPIRVGEHSNTAFGLTFAYDYALEVNDSKLKSLIESRAKDFYLADEACPISWEPSGYDFLSPCLEEMDIMRRILTKEKFAQWSSKFLPGLEDGNIKIEPGKIIDRTDGKLVHLDGLNFSRAWCLYGAAQQLNNKALMNIANQHLQFSLNNITDGDYAGEHWLASFALYALKTKGQSK